MDAERLGANCCCGLWCPRTYCSGVFPFEAFWSSHRMPCKHFRALTLIRHLQRGAPGLLAFLLPTLFFDPDCLVQPPCPTPFNWPASPWKMAISCSAFVNPTTCTGLRSTLDGLQDKRSAASGLVRTPPRKELILSRHPRGLSFQAHTSAESLRKSAWRLSQPKFLHGTSEMGAICQKPEMPVFSRNWRIPKFLASPQGCPAENFLFALNFRILKCRNLVPGLWGWVDRDILEVVHSAMSWFFWTFCKWVVLVKENLRRNKWPATKSDLQIGQKLVKSDDAVFV